MNINMIAMRRGDLIRASYDTIYLKAGTWYPVELARSPGELILVRVTKGAPPRWYPAWYFDAHTTEITESFSPEVPIQVTDIGTSQLVRTMNLVQE